MATKKKLNKIIRDSKDKKLKASKTRNVAVHKCANNQTKASKEKYKILYETSRDAIMTLEPPSWKFTSGNPATVRMFNTKDEKEFISLGPWELSPLKQPDRQLSTVKAKKMIEKAMKEGSNFFGWTHKRYKGEDFPATVLLSKVKEGGKTYLQATVRDITELKKTEEKIREREALYRALVETTGTGYVIIDTKGKVIDANAEYVRLTGHANLDEIRGRSVLEWTADYEKKKNMEAIARCAKDGHIRNLEVDYINKRGKITSVEINATVVKKNGTPQILTLCQDITARKEAKAKEKASTDKYETLVNNLSLGVYRDTPGPKGRFLEANPAIITLFEAESKKELMKHHVCDLYENPAERNLFSKKIIKQGFVKDEELNLVTLKGKKLICSVSAVVKKGKKGKIYFDGIIEDITEHKKVEKELKNAHLATALEVKKRTKELNEQIIKLEEAEKTMANLVKNLNEKQKKLTYDKAKDDALLESMGESLLATDENGNTIVINKIAEKLFGKKREEMLGKPFTEIASLEDEEGNKIDEEQRPTMLALKTGKIITAPYFMVRRDGARIPLQITSTPVVLQSKIVGAITILHDITKEKEIEKLRLDFLSLASHQLRTPLSGTKWLIDTIRGEILGSITPKQKKYLDYLYQINERMIKLVSEMLNILVLESGVEIIKKEKIYISELYKKLLLIMGPAAENRKIKIWSALENQENLFVQSDLQILQTILESFISNAIIYSQDNKEVILDVKEEPGFLIFSVKDNGIGIPKEEQKDITKRFYRASNAKEFKPDGTGLGLYTASILAQKIDGKISFESEKNKGTIFYLRIPKKINSNNIINNQLKR